MKETIFRGKPYVRRYKEPMIVLDEERCEHLGKIVHHEPCSCGSNTKIDIYLCPHKRLCSPENASSRISDVDARASVTDCKDCPLFSTNKLQKELVAITSLNPNRMQRQLRCLRSWFKLGVRPLVVNTAKELEDIKPLLPVWCESVISEDVTQCYDRPTQLINSLVNVGISRDVPFLLLNADIEIIGKCNVLIKSLEHTDKLTIGVRYNYSSGSPRHATKEAHGLDVFMLSPALAKTLPISSLGIGKPMWDYWLPYHFRSLGVAFNWIDTPYFFHERHELGWNKDEWEMGKKWMIDTYGESNDYGSPHFRKSLEA